MSNVNVNLIVNDFLEKSHEAYLMAIEIVNKPTIKYRTEGFCFFICNAWELMLKAHLIKNNNDPDIIIYKDSNNRSISLSKCVDKIFTSTTDKTKESLKFIINIRNRATHSILASFDSKLAPFFQQNISYYNDFHQKHFNDKRMNQFINPYVSINSISTLDDNSLAIYSESQDLLRYITESSNTQGLTQSVILYTTKNKHEADLTVAITKDQGESVKTLAIPKDINGIYIFTFGQLIDSVNKTLKIHLLNIKVNSHTLNKINKEYKAKDNSNFSYTIKLKASETTKYSNQYLQFIVNNIIEDESFRDLYTKKSD